MTELHPVEAHYRNKREEAKDMDPLEADWHALDQGRESSQRRYARVCNVLFGLEGRVLDLGCGTGAILDMMALKGLYPAYFHGVDGFELNGCAVRKRFERHGIAGEFEHKPMDEAFDAKERNGFDAALCIGVAGFWGMHTNRQIKALFDYMRRSATHGGIFVPLVYAHDQMGDAHVRRWPLHDLLDVLGLGEENVHVLEREFLLHW